MVLQIDMLDKTASSSALEINALSRQLDFMVLQNNSLD